MTATYQELADKMDENIARVKELKRDLKLCREALQVVVDHGYEITEPEISQVDAALARARQWEE